MIVTEFYCTREDGVELVRTFSDKGVRIRQIETGAVYDEAVDVSPLRYTYEETDQPIETLPEEDNSPEILRILMGGAI